MRIVPMMRATGASIPYVICGCMHDHPHGMICTEMPKTQLKTLRMTFPESLLKGHSRFIHHPSLGILIHPEAPWSQHLIRRKFNSKSTLSGCDGLWLGIRQFFCSIVQKGGKTDFLKFNSMPKAQIESFWDALWLGIRQLFCFK